MVNLHKLLITLVIAGFQATTHTASDEALLAAAQQNDLPGVISALEKGANINARSPGDVTAVMFAAHNGNFEMVKLLVERRADLSVQDAFFIRNAAEEAIASGDVEMVRYFNSKGAPAAEEILAFAIDKKDVPLLQAVARRRDIPDFVIAATHAVAVRKRETDVARALEGELNRRPDAIKSILSLGSDSLQRFTGRYRDDRTAQSITVILQNNQLIAMLGPRSLILFPFAETQFRAPEMPNTVFTFFPQVGQATRVRMDTRGLNLDLRRE